MADFKLSIIVPTLRRAKNLDLLLHSLCKQSLPKDQFEVLVVSNLKDSSTKKQIHKYKADLNLSYFVKGELGVNKARNLGLAHACGKILLFLDDDCEALDPNFLQTHLDTHNKYPEFDGIGGPYSNGPRTSALGRVYNLNSLSWLENSRLHSPRTLNLIGGNSSYKSTVFNGRRHFDENILFGGSESEFNQRLCKEGLRLAYFPNLQITHCPPIGLFAFCRKAFKQGLRFSEQGIPQSGRDVTSQKLGIRERYYLWIYSAFFQSGVHLQNTPQVQTPKQVRVVGTLLKAATQPLGSKVYHLHRLHSWKLLLIVKKPFHWLDLNMWKIKIPFHWLKQNVWRVLKPYYFLEFQYQKRIRPVFTRFIESKNQGRPNS